jgi:hypothetical protein
MPQDADRVDQPGDGGEQEQQQRQGAMARICDERPTESRPRVHGLGCVAVRRARNHGRHHPKPQGILNK